MCVQYGVATLIGSVAAAGSLTGSDSAGKLSELFSPQGLLTWNISTPWRRAQGCIMGTSSEHVDLCGDQLFVHILDAYK